MARPRILNFMFEGFRLDASDLTLHRGGESITLTQKAAQLLSVLVARHGQVVRKAELLEQVWPGVHVTDANLTQHIYLLRKILGSKAIVTEPKRGYRFALDVEVTYDDAPPAPGEAASRGADSDEAREWPGARARPGGALAVARGRAKRVAAASALSLVALALSVYFYGRAGWDGVSQVTGQSREGISIAVLPFRTIGGGGDYFGLGMSDVIITKLSGLRRLNVRPTSTIFRYAGRAVDPVEAGRELMVDHVLDGSVQYADGQVRVSVRLIRVSDGRSLWAAIFDERAENVFSVQDTIADKMTSRLYTNLTEDERRTLAKRQTGSLEAHEAYVQGIYYSGKRTKEAFGKSIAYFTEAIKKDPNYALAYAGLAEAYALVAIWGYDLLPQVEAFERAAALAAKALELDESLAEAHAVVAMIRELHWNDPEGAEREYRRAIELDPNNPSIHHKYGVFLQDTLNIEGAYGELRLAQQLDPRSMQINLNLCHVTYLLGRYDEAHGYCQTAREFEPHHPRVTLGIGLINLESKRYDEAIELFEAVKAEVPPYCWGPLGYAYAKSGRESDARALLASLEKIQGPPTGGEQYAKALVYAGLGDVERAVRTLKSESKNWAGYCLYIKYDPQLSALRSSADFGPLLKYCSERSK